MTGSDGQPPVFYTGNYHHLIDSKGRISFPSEWRKIVPGQQENYLVTILWPERCAGVYPSGEWERICERMRSERDHADSPALRERHRRILEHTSMASIDQNGRLSLKNDIRQLAELEGKVLLLGNLDHVEIWSRERRTKYEKSNELTEDMLFLDLSRPVSNGEMKPESGTGDES